jgi:hypothetical protein
MDGNDNDNHGEREKAILVPIRLYPSIVQNIQPTDATTTQQPTTQVHDPSTGGQRHDAVGLMGFDGNNGGGCGRCSAAL